MLFLKYLHILHRLLGFTRCLLSSYFPSNPAYIFLIFLCAICTAHLSTLHFITHMCPVGSMHYEAPHYTQALRAGRAGKGIPVGDIFSEFLQTGSWAQPASCKWEPDLFPGDKVAGAWRWQAVPSSAKVKERVVPYLYSASVPLWPIMKRNLPLPNYAISVIICTWATSGEARPYGCRVAAHPEIFIIIVIIIIIHLSWSWATCSGLTYPEVSSKIYHDSFCQLGSGISLPWVIYFEPFYLHVLSSPRNFDKMKYLNNVLVTRYIYSLTEYGWNHFKSKHLRPTQRAGQKTEVGCALPRSCVLDQHS